MIKNLVNYIEEKENCKIDSGSEIYSNYFKKLVDSVVGKDIDIKTKYGVFKCNIHEKYYGLNYYKLIFDYIFSQIGSDFNFDTIELLGDIDIGLIVLNNELYINIDEDIKDWIMSRKPDNFLLGLATGCKDIIKSGFVVKFIKTYLKSFEHYEEKRKLLGLDKSLYDFIYSNIKDYANNNESFYRNDRLKEYYRLKSKYKSKVSTSTFDNSDINSIKDLVYKYGIHDSLLRYIISNNESEYSIGYNNLRSDISDILPLLNRDMHIEYDREFLSDSDIDSAFDYIYKLRKKDNFGCSGLHDICEVLNINLQSLLGKLFSDIDLHHAMVLCIAERNRYRQGYFYYDYGSIDKVNQNEYSTKAFLRFMIENYNK